MPVRSRIKNNISDEAFCPKAVNDEKDNVLVSVSRNHTDGARLSDVLGFGVTGDQHLFKDRGSARGGRLGTA